ncbi:MAG: ABC-2 transporter permease [Coriobacteriales bacterium]|jgi:hypothetical protein|nr:ABC-2 transporter permease [Coriobacteriales bacterium]
MNRILNTAKLDFYAGLSMIRLVALLMLLAIVIGIVTNGPAYAMMLTMVFGVTSCGSVFSTYEKSRGDRLFGVLPLKKSEAIAGRYLYALITGAAYIIAAGIIGFVMSQFLEDGFDSLTYWATVGIGFAYFGFATGVAFPIYYKFSFAKAYVFTMIPMYLIAVAYLVITKRTDFVSNLTQIVDFFTEHVYLAPIFGILAGLILLLVSALVANLIYKSKEI